MPKAKFYLLKGDYRLYMQPDMGMLFAGILVSRDPCFRKIPKYS